MEVLSVFPRWTKSEGLCTKTWCSGKRFAYHTLIYIQRRLFIFISLPTLSAALSLLNHSTWRKGDILCIDNFSTSHGRQPTYDFGRKVLVAWSNPHDKTSTRAFPSIDKISKDSIDKLKKSCSSLFDDKHVPGAIEATPNPSPDSTLSGEEAQELKDLLIYQGNEEDQASKGPNNRHTSCPSFSLERMFS